jgi:hypothetical protein
MTALTIIVGLLALAWWISLWTHPWTRCPSCKGQPRTHHVIFSQHFAQCGRCGGSGKVLRRGARRQ